VLSAMEYPHWMMVAGAVLWCSGLSLLHLATIRRDAAELRPFTVQFG